MDRFKDTPFENAPCEHPQFPAIRSYEEIARILTQREDGDMSPAEVGRICHDAERKLARAVRDEPAIGQGLTGLRFKGAVVPYEASTSVPTRYPCVFQIRDASAHQVNLVIECPLRMPQTFSLRACDAAVWETTLWLVPGHYRYCYHAYDGRSLTHVVPSDAPLDGLKVRLHVVDRADSDLTLRNFTPA